MKTLKKYFTSTFVFIAMVATIQSQDIEYVVIQSNNIKAFPNVQIGTLGPISYCLDQELNSILLNLNCTVYTQDYPRARSAAGSRLFRIELADIGKYDILIELLENIDHLNEVKPIYEYYKVADCDCEEGTMVNDPHLAQFMAETINLDCAWDITQGSADIQVAAVDIFPIGADNASDDLEGKLSIVRTTIPQFNNPDPGNCNHGLGVVSAIAAIPDNEICTAGTGYNTTVVGYNAGFSCGRGAPVAPARQAYAEGQKIINLAWSMNFLTLTELQEMVDNGVTIIHAVRNSYWSDVADIPGIIGVGKSDWNNEYEEYDNGICDGAMDILMSTNGIWRPTTAGLCEESGNKNSIGSGLVSGVVALMKDVNPCLSPIAIEEILKISNQGVPTNSMATQCGVTAGIIDAYAAVCLAEDFCAEPIELNDDICATRDCSNMLISGDVIVEAGQTLTVTGSLSFAECSSLIVKREGRLVINGGVLTACGEEWKGVVVEGLTGDVDNKTGVAGKVEMINGGIIEKAAVGVSMHPRHLPWTSDYWGGYIFADNATIRDCRVGVQFMSHQDPDADFPTEDQSMFNNVVFENIRDTGVSIWDDYGIDFTKCSFINVGYGDNEHEGILALSAYINVTDNNQFIGCERGIVLESENTIIRSSRIIGNLFRCEKDGILLQNAKTRGFQRLWDNRFIGGEVGICVDGPCNFEILNNDFFDQNEEGVFLFGTGTNSNPIYDNDFVDNIRGIVYNGANGASTFQTNCFSGSFISDIEIANVPGGNIGKVWKFQGNSELEAGNVFSGNGAGEIRNNGNPIKYYVERNRPPNARQRLSPESLATNVSEEPANMQNDADDCGSEFFLVPPDENCELRFTDVDEIKMLIQRIDEYLNEGSISSVESIKAKSLKESMFFELAYLAKFSSDDNLNDISSYLMTRPEFFAKSLVPSLYLTRSNFVKAREMLALIPDNLGDATDYKMVQHINIDYSVGGVQNVSSDEMDALVSVAGKVTASSSFARALYHHITEQRIPLQKYYVEQTVNPRERVDSNELVFNCFPNPSKSGLELNIKIIDQEEHSFHYTIYSLDGLAMNSGVLDNNETKTVSTETFSSGMYIITVTDAEGKVIHTQKISIID